MHSLRKRSERIVALRNCCNTHHFRKLGDYQFQESSRTIHCFRSAVPLRISDFPIPPENWFRWTDFKDAPALLVVFICNHCPYVKHVRSSFAELAKEYQARGVAVVAINSNDAENYPEDSPAKMATEIVERGIFVSVSLR